MHSWIQSQQWKVQWWQHDLTHLQSYQEMGKGTKVRNDCEFEDSCTVILPAPYSGPLILWVRISPAFGFTGDGLLIPSRRIVEELVVSEINIHTQLPSSSLTSYFVCEIVRCFDPFWSIPVHSFPWNNEGQLSRCKKNGKRVQWFRCKRTEERYIHMTIFGFWFAGQVPNAPTSWFPSQKDTAT